MLPTFRRAFTVLAAACALAGLQGGFAAEPLDPKTLDLEKLAKSDHVRTSDEIAAAQKMEYKKANFGMTPQEYAKEFKCTPGNSSKDYVLFLPVRSGIQAFFDKRTNKMALLKYVLASPINNKDAREVLAEFVSTYGPPTEQVSRENARQKSRSTDYVWKFPMETRRGITVTVTYSYRSFMPQIEAVLFDPTLAPDALVQSMLRDNRP